MNFGLFWTCVYLVATFLRPQELFLELSHYSIMEVLAGVALATTGLDILSGLRPNLRQLQIYLLALFVLWAAVSVVAAWRWFGGAALAFQALSTNLFAFVLIVLNGTALKKLDVMRYATLTALLVTVVLGLRAYYLGPRQAEFVMSQPIESDARESSGGPWAAISSLANRLLGRSPENAEAPDTGATDPEAELTQGERTGLEGERLDGRPVVRRLRALGFLNDPNDLAQALVAALPLLFLGWRSSRPVRNAFVILPAATIFLWAVALTRSRGGLLALAALVWIAVSERLGRWARLLSVAGVAGLLGALVLFFGSGAADDSAMGRLEAWSAGLQMLKGSPLWGVGFGSFADQHELAAHNSFVHCYAELGVVGYFAWLGAIVATFWSLNRLQSEPGLNTEAKKWARALRLSLAAFLVGALFLSRTYSVTLFVIVGLATAVAGAASDAESPGQFSMPLVALVVRTVPLLLVSIVLTYIVVLVGR